MLLELFQIISTWLTLFWWKELDNYSTQLFFPIYNFLLFLTSH